MIDNAPHPKRPLRKPFPPESFFSASATKAFACEDEIKLKSSMHAIMYLGLIVSHAGGTEADFNRELCL